MKILPKSITKLVESFEKLPGVGPKTAQRLALYLLHVPQGELDSFAENVKELKNRTKLCSVCRNVTESDPCEVCSDTGRDQSVICVVEQPSDVVSIEKTGRFKGLYHVLHGRIDPLNNIGPEEIFLEDLLKRILPASARVNELIIATNPNMEGEATAMFIQREVSKNKPTAPGQEPSLNVTRLARGLPVGADIEYADEVTLTRALENRKTF